MELISAVSQSIGFGVELATIQSIRCNETANLAGQKLVFDCKGFHLSVVQPHTLRLFLVSEGDGGACSCPFRRLGHCRAVQTPGGGDREKTEDHPHAKQTSHAPEPALWSPDKER
jgi:hypothetical protein